MNKYFKQDNVIYGIRKVAEKTCQGAEIMVKKGDMRKGRQRHVFSSVSPKVLEL